jgi:hypothetical protein
MTRVFYERSSAISIKDVVPEGANTATKYYNIGEFYYHLADEQSTDALKRTQLKLVKKRLAEAHRI